MKSTFLVKNSDSWCLLYNRPHVSVLFSQVTVLKGTLISAVAACPASALASLRTAIAPGATAARSHCASQRRKTLKVADSVVDFEHFNSTLNFFTSHSFSLSLSVLALSLSLPGVNVSFPSRPGTPPPLSSTQIMVNPDVEEFQLVDLSRRFLDQESYWILPRQFLGSKVILRSLWLN